MGLLLAVLLCVVRAEAGLPEPTSATPVPAAPRTGDPLGLPPLEMPPGEALPGLVTETPQCARSPLLTLHRGVRVTATDLFYGPRDDPWPGLTPSASNAAWTRVSQSLRGGQLPPPGAVRPEELVAALPPEASPPPRGQPLVVRAEAARSPWTPDVALIRISVTTRRAQPQQRQPVHLAVVVDTHSEGKDGLAQLRDTLRTLVGALRPDDVLAVVDSGAGVVLPAAPVGDGRAALAITDALVAQPRRTDLPGALAQGYALLAGSQAGARRLMLISDGDLSLIERGDELAGMAAELAKQGMSFAAVGHGSNHGRDEGMEALARESGGTYLHVAPAVDRERSPELREAQREERDAHARQALREQLDSLLEPVVDDVRLLVDWGPAVAGIHRSGHHHERLRGLGPEQAVGRELGAGRTVSVVYEVRLLPGQLQGRGHTPLGTVRVQSRPAGAEQPRIDTAEIPVPKKDLAQASPELQLAVAASTFAELLGRSRSTERASALLALAEAAQRDQHPEDAELVDMIRLAIPLLRAPQCW